VVLLCGFSAFSLPKGTPKVHQVGLKNWQPAVASYQKGCKTTFLIKFAFAQQKIKNEPAHGLIIFFIIDTIATGSRSPAGPRHRRKRTHAIGVHPFSPVVLSVAILPAAQDRAVAGGGKAPVSPCVPLCAILLRKPSVYPLLGAKANVGRL